MAARLVEDGHEVVLHARDEARAQQALDAVPGARAALSGDLACLRGMADVAAQANRLGRFDSIIHNAALGYREPRRIETVDGLPHVLAINTLAPYVLTALIDKPRRLIYLSSGLHRSGDASLDDLEWRTRRWDGTAAYSDSKLHDVLLAFAIARRWPDVLSNARSNRAGSRRRWAAPARPTISMRRRAPRSRSRPATIPRRASAGSTSII
jgi:NAD(P)-dependent dehydrogenase (short-subunit alcohol dehydrogenase family)